MLDDELDLVLLPKLGIRMSACNANVVQHQVRGKPILKTDQALQKLLAVAFKGGEHPRFQSIINHLTTIDILPARPASKFP